jgi:hypothetical protein
MAKKKPYMEFYYGKQSENSNMPKQPYMERYCKNKELANIERAKSTAPVALDTNQTRRKNTLLPLPNAIPKKSAASQGKLEKVRIPK